MKKYKHPKAFVLLLIGLWPFVAKADLQDPTLPPGFNEGGPLVLSAIMISATNKLAVINGKIEHVGDLLAGNKITNIEPNFVVLDGPEGKITLVLLTDPAKVVPAKDGD